MLGLAAAAVPAVLLQRRIPVATKEMQGIAPTPIAAPAPSGDHRHRVPAGAKEASLSSPPRFLAAGPVSAFRSEAIGPLGEARVMVRVRRLQSVGHGAKLREELYPIIAIIGNK